MLPVHTLDAPAMDRPALLAALRARIAHIERAGAARALDRSGHAAIPLAPAIDRALPWGGLARAALHEILGPNPGAATAFAALILGRASGEGGRASASLGTVLWIAQTPEAWPPGLARFGLLPETLILVQAPTPRDGLWAMEEALRCPAIAGVVLQQGEADLTAARRLQLAAEAGGTIGLLLRDDAAAAEPSAALTRWRVTPIAGTGGPHALGDPGWRLDLLRCRGGQPHGWDARWRVTTETLHVEASESQATSEAPRRRSARIANHSHKR